MNLRPLEKFRGLFLFQDATMRKSKANHTHVIRKPHPQDAIFPVGTAEDRKEAHRLPSLVNGVRVYPKAHYEHQAWMKGQTKA